MAAEKGYLKCTLLALLTGWVTMVFVTSALIVLLGVPNSMTVEGVGRPGLAAATWRVADEVGPAVKLLLIAIFAVLVLLGERSGLRRLWQRYALNMIGGIGAMLLALGLVPGALSRGFGIGLTGARFDPSVLSIYLVGGALGGVAFTVSVTRCGTRASLTG